MNAPTPLLDFFRRGEVARDVKILAAEGALAPRAHEQLALLILLHDDPDREIRDKAVETLDRIPTAALKNFLARPDVAIGTREFFADRGVFPDEMPTLTSDDEPLIEVGTTSEAADEEDENETRESLTQRISKMTFTDRLRAALKGSREMRSLLIRDPNKMVAASVLSSPKLTDAEVEGYARMQNVSEDVLRIIGSNRAWTKTYSIVVALTKNAKTPLAVSLNLMARLNDRDVSALSIDRNVPEPLRTAARRKVVFGQSR